MGDLECVIDWELKCEISFFKKNQIKGKVALNKKEPLR